MAIEYLGLSEINGPLVVLEGVKNASFEEIVEFHMDDGTQKIGRIVEIYEDKAVIQVFEGTDNMSLSNTHTRLTGHPMEIGLSEEILGRTFNGIGQPIDGLGEITPEVSLNINGLPLNRAIYTEDGDMQDIYAGDFLVVGLTEDDFGSLTSEQMQKFEEQFHQPQMFVRMGRSIMAIPVPDDMVKKIEEKAAKPQEKSKPAPDRDSL